MLLELQQFLRQTDGMRLVVSSRAIFNDDFDAHIPIEAAQYWSPYVASRNGADAPAILILTQGATRDPFVVPALAGVRVLAG